jgi:NAD(P)-dependent dehydrogenase (short-subunit alcohol dehydrogenase family)/acyl carrier protein
VSPPPPPPPTPPPAPASVITERDPVPERDPVAGWLHHVRWEPVAPASVDPAAAAGTWVVLDDGEGVGAGVVERLTRAGATCVVARPGSAFERLDHTAWQLDPMQPQGFAELVRQACAGRAPLRGVVHLWSLRGAPDDLAAAEALSAASVLHLAQALAGVPDGHAPRLWLVTRGAQAAGDAADPVVPAPFQALSWGIGRVIQLEHLDRWGGLIDLAPAASAGETAAADAEALMAELLGTGGDDQIALRAGQRHAARLVPHGPTAAAAPALRGDRTYLITGGLGALGLRVAGWLVERGARHLALLGRRAPGAHAEAALAGLRAAGAEVVLLRGDVAVADDVARALAAIDAGMPALAGVIHAAGVLDDTVLINQRWPGFAAVLAPKLRGAWHLHRLTRAHALELFVLFSSAAAVLGSMAQGSYAAANAALDALAHHRRAQGLPALAIDWSLWAEGGMIAALDETALRRWRARGVTPMPPDQALSALDRAIASGRANIAVLPIDWAAYGRMAPSAGGAPALLARLLAPIPGGPADRGGSLAAALQYAAPARRRQLVLDHLKGRLAAVLGLDPARPIDPQQGFFDMGMDSLMAVELRNRLQLDAGISLSTTVLFNYATLSELTDHLLALHAPRTAEPTRSPAAPAAALDAASEAELAALPEAELAALLDAQLSDILGDPPGEPA